MGVSHGRRSSAGGGQAGDGGAAGGWRRTRDARPQVNYAAATVRSSGGLCDRFRLFEATRANRRDVMFSHQTIQTLVVLPDCGILSYTDLHRATGAKVVRPGRNTKVPGFDEKDLRKRQSLM